MFIAWFDTREATALGRSLADHFVPSSPQASAGRSKKRTQSDQNAMQAFVARVEREARHLSLNIYKRAKLASSFKWRLAEHGIEQRMIDELSRMLLMRLSANGAGPAPAGVSESSQRAQTVAGRGNALLVLGDQCSLRGLYDEAATHYRNFLKEQPRHAVARNNLGVAHCKLGRYGEAEQEFALATQAKRNYPDAFCNLGTVLRWRGHIPDSEAPLRRAAKLSPKYAEAHASLGMTLALLGRLSEAKESLERALKISPHHQGALLALGEVASFEGHFDEAESWFIRVLEIEPKHPGAWAARAKHRKMTRADNTWLEEAESIATSGIAPLDEASIRFAIGKYWDDVGDFPRAFRSYQRANDLLKGGADPYDRAWRSSFVDDLIRLYTRDNLARPAPGGSDSERPVFVTGMARSGTSLVEQIISSHPDAKGAGELGFWNKVLQKHEDVVRHELLGESLRVRLAQEFLRTLSVHSSTASRVVDKSVFNADFMGVIHSVFPKARFIYVERDPVDTCLSCYFQQFALSLNFTMDLSDLAHYYREHQRLVTHWRSLLSADTLLVVPYADLVADQEGWTRKALEFLGLPWDPKCLQFHQTSRPVRTASVWQVRQRIYGSSVGRWRNYRKFIGPLLELAERT